ncbi:MAG: 50S ribosomal protein L28 [Planctomycetes bacterium]|nr:50S ribosomal protein L28 [Planctomycetota bacterium]
MGAECAICGKKKSMGYSLARRGLPKKKGGGGQHISGRTKRAFKPNLQTVRANVNGTVKRLRVCTKCLRSGKVTKVVS